MRINYVNYSLKHKHRLTVESIVLSLPSDEGSALERQLMKIAYPGTWPMSYQMLTKKTACYAKRDFAY